MHTLGFVGFYVPIYKTPGKVNAQLHKLTNLFCTSEEPDKDSALLHKTNLFCTFIESDKGTLQLLYYSVHL